MAVSFSITELIQKVKDLVPELKSSGHDARILRWLNDERRKLINDSRGGMSARRFKERQYLDSVADTPRYDLPDDFMELATNGVAVRYDADDDYTRAEVTEREDLDGLTDDTVRYALADNCIVIYPTPEAVVDKAIRLDYYGLGDEWTAGTSDIGRHWHRYAEILAVGAALRSGIRYEDGRAELERHYDDRLFPNFRRTFPRRDRTARTYKLVRPVRRHGKML